MTCAMCVLRVVVSSHALLCFHRPGRALVHMIAARPSHSSQPRDGIQILMYTDTSNTSNTSSNDDNNDDNDDGVPFMCVARCVLTIAAKMVDASGCHETSVWCLPRPRAIVTCMEGVSQSRKSYRCLTETGSCAWKYEVQNYGRP